MVSIFVEESVGGSVVSCTVSAEASKATEWRFRWYSERDESAVDEPTLLSHPGGPD
jgi:hypothetical protein